MGGRTCFGNGTVNRAALLAAAGLAAFAAFFCTGCGEDNGNGGGGDNGTYVEPDDSGNGGSACGADFRSVPIGTQTWMAENLNCDMAGGVCYKNSADSCAKYGRLYTWDAAMKACPAGWHLPSDDEWAALMDYAGSKAGTKLKSPMGWDSYDGVPAGTDDYGFSALPGGIGNGGGFGNVGGGIFLWSVTEFNASLAWGRSMDWCHEGTGRKYFDKVMMFSVRCVRDES